MCAPKIANGMMKNATISSCKLSDSSPGTKLTTVNRQNINTQTNIPDSTALIVFIALNLTLQITTGQICCGYSLFICLKGIEICLKGISY